MTNSNNASTSIPALMIQKDASKRLQKLLSNPNPNVAACQETKCVESVDLIDINAPKNSTTTNINTSINISVNITRNKEEKVMCPMYVFQN